MERQLQEQPQATNDLKQTLHVKFDEAIIKEREFSVCDWRAWIIHHAFCFFVE
jgi:hypothetical protein